MTDKPTKPGDIAPLRPGESVTLVPIIRPRLRQRILNFLFPHRLIWRELADLNCAVDSLAASQRVLSERIKLAHLRIEILERRLNKCCPRGVASFIIEQLPNPPSGDTTMITGVKPGTPATFVAKPLDAQGQPSQVPAGLVPSWQSSDPTNFPITPAADGLSVQVAAAPGAQPGSSFTLTVQMTNPDNSQPSGTATIPVLFNDVASFVIDQQ